MTKLRHSPPTPDKFESDVRATIANLWALIPDYRHAYQMGYTSERRGGDKVRVMGSDPTGSTVESRESVRRKLSVVGDVVCSDKGIRGASATALTDTRSILDHDRVVMRDLDLQKPRDPKDLRRLRDGSYGAPSKAEMEQLRARQRARGVEV